MAVTRWLEAVAPTKRQDAEMEVADFKMLRFSLGVARMDKNRNEYIRVTAHVGRFGENTRGNTDVVWPCTEERGHDCMAEVEVT